MIVNKTRVWLGSSLVLLSMGLFWACKTEEKLPALGERIAGPVDVATAPSGSHFYVLNSDFERRFNEGSIMVIDPETPTPTKVNTIPIPRLGRSLDVAQNLLLVTYDAEGEEILRRIDLWNVENETNPTLVTSWNIECSPINGILAPSQPYFVVSCLNGDVFMGHLNRSDLAASTLDRVRSYGFAHRALYFYESAAGTWLLGFPSDLDFPDVDDFPAVDKGTYDPVQDKMLENVADEIPDLFQNTPQARRRPSNGYPYQMFIYNVSAEETASAADPEIGTAHFRYMETGTFARPNQVNKEMRYVYYVLRELDGTPASGEGTVDIDQRIYRTNFWTARSAPGGASEIFYLSQRGNSYGSTSNNVLKVEINPTALAAADSSKFTDMFKVQRVYGFANDRDSIARYPGAFAVTEIEGEPMLLVNHFRDLINFSNAPFYSITRKFLNPPFSLQQASSYDSTAYEASFYQLAVSKTGKLLTCSFYGHSLYLFDVSPRTSMRDQTPIRIE
jgi:DNA-binding beta-propeller fold protein YncE